MMTPDKIRERLRKIEEVAHDDERAHSLEDELHDDVLYAIATNNCTDVEACAALAMRSRQIKFNRWHA